jgi:hypothetical protein
MGATAYNWLKDYGKRERCSFALRFSMANALVVLGDWIGCTAPLPLGGLI